MRETKPMTTGFARACEWGSLIGAFLGSTGSLYLSLGMGLNACPLCFYQRTFVFGILGVLAMSSLAGSRIPRGLSCLLITPLALGGLGTAVFHVRLELKGTLECPDGILALGTAPQQSLAVFTVLSLLAVAGACASLEAGGRRKTLAGIALGILLALGCVLSAPPLPPAKVRPSKAEGYELKGCEPAPARAP